MPSKNLRSATIKAAFLKHQSYAGMQNRLEEEEKVMLGDPLEDFVGIPGIHECLDYHVNSINEK